MPEGHTLHRLAGECADLVGRRVRATSPQGRFAAGATTIDGRCLDGVECLWATLTAMMRRATTDGRIITVDVATGVDRASVAEPEARNVYEQDRCRRCGGTVRSWDTGGRTAYACERCQRPVGRR